MILSAFCLFQADTVENACCLRPDCDAKVFGMKIYKHLTNSDSNIIAVAAGPQSTNGLVESYWKEVMVHMSRAYLTKKHTFMLVLFGESLQAYDESNGPLYLYSSWGSVC